MGDRQRERERAMERSVVAKRGGGEEERKAAVM